MNGFAKIAGTSGLVADGSPNAGQSYTVPPGVSQVPLTFASAPSGAPSVLVQVFFAFGAAAPALLTTASLSPGGSVVIAVPPPPVPVGVPTSNPFPTPALQGPLAPSRANPTGTAPQLFTNPAGALGVASNPYDPPAGFPQGLTLCVPFQETWQPAPSPGTSVGIPSVILYFALGGNPSAPAGPYIFEVG